MPATSHSCLRRAEKIAPSTSEVIGRLLGERLFDRPLTVLGILNLAHKMSRSFEAPERLLWCLVRLAAACKDEDWRGKTARSGAVGASARFSTTPSIRSALDVYT